MSTTAHGNGSEGNSSPEQAPAEAGHESTVPVSDGTEGDDAAQPDDEAASDREQAAQVDDSAAAADPDLPATAAEPAEADETGTAEADESGTAQEGTAEDEADDAASSHGAGVASDAAAEHATSEVSATPPAVAAEEAQEPTTGEDAGAAADVEQTHVAIPAAAEDDPFSEVDGGDESVPRSSVPTPEEDAALREERARRFGRPQPGAEPAAPAVPSTAAPAAQEQEPTQAVPLAEAGAGAVASVGDSDTASTQTMPSAEEDPFKDFDEGPQSRTASHWWTILISIVFVPLAWYLIADGGERMTFTFINDEPFNPASAIELGAGALCLFFVLLAARWSSVGSIITGSIATLAGGAFLVFNAEAMEYILQYQGTLVQALDQVGQNIIDHLLRDAEAGRIVVYGIVLIMCGVISHGARRQGRREERRKAAAGL